MSRTDPHKMPACIWSLRKAFCRVLVVLAVLGLVAEFAQPGRAHAGEGAHGFEIVICSGDGAVTIMIDREGNPIEAPGETVCDCGCASCPSSGGVCPVHEPSAFEILVSFSEAAPCAPKTARLASERGRLPIPRGPPTEKEA